MPRMFWPKPSPVLWSVSAIARPAALLALAFAPSRVAAQVVAESHTVREGDTLWDLAKKYRGDPFLWPDIYRLNTDVVEDPHWIYPGEVLRLTAADNVRAVPSTDTPPPNPNVPVVPTPPIASADSGVPKPVSGGDVGVQDGRPLMPGDSGYVPLFPSTSRPVARETLRAYVDQTYNPLRRTEFYSSGFLTENQPLPFGTLLGPVTPSQIRSYSNRDVATLYTDVGVEPPAKAIYQIGDSLLVVYVGEEIQGYGKIIVPAGLARVSGATDGRYVATIVALYGPIRKGLRVVPAERFVSGGTARAQPVANGVRGMLLGGARRQELKAPQMVVFIDKGKQDGVAPGDLFEARRQPQRLPDGTLRVDEVMAEFQVVRVGERSATARILNVLSPDLPAGTEVRQVAKLP